MHNLVQAFVTGHCQWRHYIFRLCLFVRSFVRTYLVTTVSHEQLELSRWN